MGQSSALTAKAFLGLVNLLALMAVALLLSAGTWRYGLGWIFLLEFFACALAVTISLIRHDPALLQRRVAAGPAAEGRTRQKVVQAIAGLAFLSIIVVPALDRRLGWSPVPVPGVVLGQLLVAVGFLIVFRVFRGIPSPRPPSRSPANRK